MNTENMSRIAIPDSFSAVLIPASSANMKEYTSLSFGEDEENSDGPNSSSVSPWMSFISSSPSDARFTATRALFMFL